MAKRKHKTALHPPKKSGPKGPMKFNADVILKLKAAFSNYANVEEACFHAGISVNTFYYNAPEGSELYHELMSFRMGPALKAKRTVMESLGKEDMAWKFLKNTRPGEFAEKIIHQTDEKPPEPLGDRAKNLLLDFKNAQTQTPDKVKPTPATKKR